MRALRAAIGAAAPTSTGAARAHARRAWRTTSASEHAMLLMLDAARAAGSTRWPAAATASRAWAPRSRSGDGVIGVAARERTPIRINHAQAEYALRPRHPRSACASGLSLETRDPAARARRLAQPARACRIEPAAGQLLGRALRREPAEDMRFGYDDEDALVALAAQLGAAIHAAASACADEAADERPRADAAGARAAAATARRCAVRHYADERQRLPRRRLPHQGRGRRRSSGSCCADYARDTAAPSSPTANCAWTRAIRLPDLGDNLEARLILLSRRLQEKNAPIRIQKPARGCLQLQVERPVELVGILAPR
ncbi:MAG: hypothetical protein MZW92_44020 [Comamonadaceae bacterium]|nr:hypothetical protein [Comamonadaceae bacterium]